MIRLLFLLLCSSHLHAVIIKGVSYISHSVKMVEDRHPSIKLKPDQNKVKSQLAVLNAFAQSQSQLVQENIVVLAEEISPSIAKYIGPNEACILNDMRKVAEAHELKCENIDLRGAILAARHALNRSLRREPIDLTLEFGPTQDSLKKPLLVILDDLFEEKERYIDCIRKFSWSDGEQKKLDIFHKELFDALQGRDLDTTVCRFCEETSDEVKNQVYKKMNDMSLYLFDNYTRKTVVDYSERGHTVLLAAGYEHINNVMDQLEIEHSWQDYRIHYSGDVLANYDLKSTLDIATCWDHTKSFFGYVD